MLPSTTSRREFKQFAERAYRRLLKDNVSLTYDQMLEAMAAAAGQPAWNVALSKLQDSTPEELLPRDATPPFGPTEPKPRFLADLSCSWESNAHSLIHGVDLIIAAPGGGKSMIAARSSLAWCAVRIERNPQDLPRLLIFDVGGSYAGMLDTLRDALPEQRREVSRRKLDPNGADRINPFDTYLGLRQPTALQMQAIIALLVVCISRDPQLGSAHSSKWIEATLTRLVRQVYQTFSDQEPGSTPKPYKFGVELSVDALLKKHRVPSPSTWWACVDVLSAVGETEVAVQAQSQAVPVLEDVLQAVPGDSEGFETSEDQALQQVLRTAWHDEPMLQGATHFHHPARIACLDLYNINPFNADGLDRMGLGFLLARSATIGGMLPDEEVLTLAPRAYQDFHRKHLAEVCASERRMVLDEANRYTRNPAINALIAHDMDRAREAGVSVCMALQVLTDTTGEMLKKADSVRCCGGLFKSDATKLAEELDLSPGTANVLISGRQGMIFGTLHSVVRRKQADGISQESFESIQANPTLLWALSTNGCDKELRSQVYARKGGLEGRRLLVKAFPKGTAKAEYERQVFAAGGVTNVIDAMCQEICG